MSIKVNSVTCGNLSKQLIEKYSYLKKEKSNLVCIFITWVIGPIPYSARGVGNLVKVIKDNQNNDDVGNILETITPSSLLSKFMIKKYQIYHKHKLTDFPIIHFAADFYGKSIEELASDAMEMYNEEHYTIKKIKSQTLRNQIKHLVECEILVVLGVLFFYLKIATIIDHFN